MTDTTQTQVAAPTSPAEAAGTTPAPAGETVPPVAAAPKATLLGGEDKPEGTEAKPSGENKTTPEAGDVIEVKMPEGVTVDKAALDAFMPAFKEAKLTSEQASTLAATYAKVVESNARAQEDAIWKQSDAWQGELAKEYGDKLKPMAVAAKKVLLKYGGVEAVKLFNHPALGNHPVLFKIFAAIGNAGGEDNSSAKTPPDSQVGTSEAERLKARYNKSQR